MEWTIKDMVTHDVTQVPNHWTSSNLPPGKSWKMAVGESADYYCSIHVVMVGSCWCGILMRCSDPHA